MTHHRANVIIAGSAWIAAIVIALPALAAGAAPIKVKWDDPELKAFTSGREALRSAGVEPEVEPGLEKLQIPVLAFEQPPEVVVRNLKAGPESVDRVIHSDPANPIWYQIVEDYGDVSVSVSADLRAQHSFPANFPIYDKPAPGAGVDTSSEPSVSVMDEAVEEGMEGFIAEYTIERYGVPYIVTIECTAAARDQCKDKAQLAKDSALLKLVAGGPPK
jgi:hypothetical protein